MKTRLTRAAAFLLSCGFFMSALPAMADSQALPGFDPENLISDANMYGDVAFSMDAADIQAFLEDKGSRCIQGADGSPCLKNATFRTENYAPTRWCSSSFEGANADTAAQVIAKAAQACEISPKVLLVLLQKEQGLITTQNPTKRAYSKATGFACPDSAPCDPSKAGFPTQVYAAASRLQQYRLQPERFNHAVGRTSTVFYHPNKSCGSRKLTMATAATAALYNYTPYLPNAAALANPYGTGDSCSAYGNRNFYRLHRDWFGTPNAGGGERPQNVPQEVPDRGTQEEKNEEPTPPSPSYPLAQHARHPQRDLNGDGVNDLLYSKDGAAQRGEGWGDGSDMGFVDINALLHGRTPDTSPTAHIRHIGNGWKASGTAGVGDWNGDGYSDFVHVLPNGTLRFYEGRANFAWGPLRIIGNGWRDYTPLMGGSDFDGDGHMDIVARNNRTGTLRLYSNSGRLGWKGVRTIGAGWGIFSHLTIIPSWSEGNAAVAAVEATSGRIRIYTTDGRGNFNGRIDLSEDWKKYVSITGVADVTGDGRGDIQSVTADGEVVTYAAHGKSLRQHARQETGVSAASILSGGTTSGTHYFLVDRSGRLYAVKAGKAPVDDSLATQSTGITVGVDEKLIDLGDWTGDGYPDFMRWTAAKQMALHPGTGSGTWSSSGRIVGNGWHFDDVIPMKDWEDTGKPALLAWNRSTGAVYLYPFNGRGSWEPRLTLTSDLTWADLIADGGNWDGQGGFQLLVRRQSTGTLELLRADSVAIDTASSKVIGEGWASKVSVTGSGDLNKDGYDDIVTTNNDGTLTVYLGAGDGRVKEVREVNGQ